MEQPRSELSTTAEKNCVDKVKSFIQQNNQAMYMDAPRRKEAENRDIYIEDLARAMVRAAELVWLKHLQDDIKNVIEQVTASGNSAKIVSDVAVDKFASQTLTTVGAGPATAVPLAMEPFIPLFSSDTVKLNTAKNKPLNIQVPDSTPITVL